MSKVKYLKSMYENGKIKDKEVMNAFSKELINKEGFRTIVGEDIDLDNLRDIKIKEGKNNTRKVILSRFRDDHQLNLYDGTKADIPDMWKEDVRVSDYQIVIDFKKEVINATHFYEQQLINATTLEEVESVSNDPQTIIDRAYENTANEDYNINLENVEENL